MTRSSESLIRVCTNHEEYLVPMVPTMVFHSYERWCPFCGWATGSAFSDHSRRVPATDELNERLWLYTIATEDYLRSVRFEAEPLEWEKGRRAEDLGIELPQLIAVECDGCGKVAKAPAEDGKPPAWFGHGRGEDRLLACSEACTVKASDKAGLTGMRRMISPL